MRYTPIQPATATAQVIATAYQRYLPIAFRNVNSKAPSPAILPASSSLRPASISAALRTLPKNTLTSYHHTLFPLLVAIYNRISQADVTLIQQQDNCIF